MSTALTSSGGEQVSQNSLLVQPNGDIVAAGEAGGETYQAIARYTPTGALDPTFGNGGIVLQQNGSGTANAINVLAIQSNGDLVAVIVSPKAQGLERFTTTGQVDTSFGKSGVATDSTLSYSFMSDIAIQPADGNIVLVGEARGTASADFAVSQFNTDGTLDTTFGSNGNVLTSFNGHGTGANAVAIQSNGAIVVAGSVSSRSEPVWSEGTGEFALARYNSNGSLDSTFGSGGLVTTPAGALPSSASLSGIAIQPDGKIIAVGNGSFMGSSGTVGPGVVLVRFNADGSLDTTFGNGGIELQPATVAAGGSPAEGVALEANGEIVTSGHIQVSSSQWETEVAVFNPDGTLDTNFGGTGVVLTAVPTTGMGGAYSVAVQPADGNIVVGGNNGGQFFLARYIGDSRPMGQAAVVRSAPRPTSQPPVPNPALAPLVLDSPDFWDSLKLKKRSR